MMEEETNWKRRRAGRRALPVWPAVLFLMVMVAVCLGAVYG